MSKSWVMLINLMNAVVTIITGLSVALAFWLALAYELWPVFILVCFLLPTWVNFIFGTINREVK